MPAPCGRETQPVAFDKASVVRYRNRFALKKGAMDGSGNSHEGKKTQKIGP